MIANRVLRMAAASVGLACGLVASAETIDAVLAVVDREPILQSDLLSTVAPELNLLDQSGRDSQEVQREFDRLMEQALQEAINNKILTREALLAGLQVSDDEIEERINKIRELYDSNEAFMADLRDSGETMSDIRERVREQLLAVRMAVAKRNQFERDVVVSESEVAQYYEDHIEEYQRPERVRVRQIFMAAGSDAAERAQVQARMEQVHDELEAGADFAEMAAQYSEAVGADEGGVIGWTLKGDLVEPLNETAFALGEREFSEVLETANGFHILMVSEREEAGTASLDEVRTEIAPLLRRQAADERYQRWLAEQRKRSRVQVFM